MEGIVNPYWSDLVTDYPLFLGETMCGFHGIYIVKTEHLNFNIKEKIQKLDEIIDKIITKLNNISYENKDNLLETIKSKKNMLPNLIIKFEEIQKNYKEIDKYYREQLFEFYKEKYDDCSIFAFLEKKKYLSIMDDIQFLLKDKFDSYLNDYFKLRNSFFEINNYIIKVKILFQI